MPILSNMHPPRPPPARRQQHHDLDGRWNDERLTNQRSHVDRRSFLFALLVNVLIFILSAETCIGAAPHGGVSTFLPLPYDPSSAPSSVSSRSLHCSLFQSSSRFTPGASTTPSIVCASVNARRMWAYEASDLSSNTIQLNTSMRVDNNNGNIRTATMEQDISNIDASSLYRMDSHGHIFDLTLPPHIILRRHARTSSMGSAHYVLGQQYDLTDALRSEGGTSDNVGIVGVAAARLALIMHANGELRIAVWATPLAINSSATGSIEAVSTPSTPFTLPPTLLLFNSSSLVRRRIGLANGVESDCTSNSTSIDIMVASREKMIPTEILSDTTQPYVYLRCASLLIAVNSNGDVIWHQTPPGSGPLPPSTSPPSSVVSSSSFPQFAAVSGSTGDLFVRVLNDTTSSDPNTPSNHHPQYRWLHMDARSGETAELDYMQAVADGMQGDINEDGSSSNVPTSLRLQNILLATDETSCSTTAIPCHDSFMFLHIHATTEHTNTDTGADSEARTQRHSGFLATFLPPNMTQPQPSSKHLIWNSASATPPLRIPGLMHGEPLLVSVPRADDSNSTLPSFIYWLARPLIQNASSSSSPSSSPSSTSNVYGTPTVYVADGMSGRLVKSFDLASLNLPMYESQDAATSSATVTDDDIGCRLVGVLQTDLTALIACPRMYGALIAVADEDEAWKLAAHETGGDSSTADNDPSSSSSSSSPSSLSSSSSTGIDPSAGGGSLSNSSTGTSNSTIPASTSSVPPLSTVMRGLAIALICVLVPGMAFYFYRWYRHRHPATRDGHSRLGQIGLNGVHGRHHGSKGRGRRIGAGIMLDGSLDPEFDPDGELEMSSGRSSIIQIQHSDDTQMEEELELALNEEQDQRRLYTTSSAAAVAGLSSDQIEAALKAELDRDAAHSSSNHSVKHGDAPSTHPPSSSSQSNRSTQLQNDTGRNSRWQIRPSPSNHMDEISMEMDDHEATEEEEDALAI